jgi:hypothetical protein
MDGIKRRQLRFFFVNYLKKTFEDQDWLNTVLPVKKKRKIKEEEKKNF